MKRSIIATGVALALVFGAVTSSAAMTYTFPPEVPVRGDVGGAAQTNWAFENS